MLLLPRLGTPGAAVSAVITESLVVIVLMRQWERSGEWLRGLLPQLGRLAIAAGVMLGLLLALRPATLIGADLGRAVQVGLALLVGGLAYVGLTLGLGAISAGDRAFIRQVLISMPGGGLIARVWKQAWSQAGGRASRRSRMSHRYGSPWSKDWYTRRAPAMFPSASSRSASQYHGS